MRCTQILIALATLVAVLGAWGVATAEVFEGYNLFAPIQSTQTFLIDNDGDVIHTWSSTYRPGLSVYLLEDGTLLRTANTGDRSFNVGGAGGRVEQIDWDSNLVWSFDYSTDQHRLHHDVEVLPNGNLLMIAWEVKSRAEATAAGRNPGLLNEGELWPDYIIEVEPSPSSGGTIVWEWHVWDHLIQDYDATKANYGTVVDHPELIDLNYASNPKADWNHINSIDYSSELDQIVLSVRNFSEIWIIDHSTSSAQAAGHAGGNSGRGGDLLYRWGNPQAYDAGTAGDQQLFVQHDAEWIEDGLPGAGNILVFNNGAGRPGGNFSSVDEIVPPLLGDGSYESGLPFGPSAPTWFYQASPTSELYADRISGAQRLDNGNTLICSGTGGLFFEITASGDTIWEYQHGSDVFRVERYGLSYAGLSPGSSDQPTDPSYTYWVEIAANLEGQNNSWWRTDLAILNPSAVDTAVTVVLHGENEHSLSDTIPGSSQAVFEDIVGLLGVTGKGALEIRAEQPLAAMARIYNQDSQGTFGQLLDALTSDDGLATGESAWLLGLRQLEGVFRTNLSVTNTGTETATVQVRLYATDGTVLHTYTLSVAPAEVVQDLEPFSRRAGRTALGWGFAQVYLETGAGVLCSASVVDSATGDATTIAMKR